MIQATPLPRSLEAELSRRIALTVEEVAQLLGLGRSAAYEACRRGQIPTRRLGHRVLIPVPALIDWLRSGADR